MIVEKKVEPIRTTRRAVESIPQTINLMAEQTNKQRRSKSIKMAKVTTLERKPKINNN